MAVQTHHKKCRQSVFTDRGRKRERVHWYLLLGVVKSECKFLYGYLEESTERMLQMALKESRRCLLKKRTPRTTRRKRRKSETGRKKPYMESLLGWTSGGWRRVLEMAQEWFYKKGTELILVKHSIDMIRPLRHQNADFVVTPLKQYGILSVDKGSLPREKIGLEKWG